MYSSLDLLQVGLSTRFFVLLYTLLEVPSVKVYTIFLGKM